MTSSWFFLSTLGHVRFALPADFIVAGLRTSKTEEELDRGNKVEVEGESRLSGERIAAIAERVYAVNFILEGGRVLCLVECT